MNDKAAKKYSGFGALLRGKRQEGEISLDRVHRATRVSRAMLQAMEEEDFQALPADVYVRGFIKAYADYLNLDSETVMERYEAVAPRQGARAHLQRKTDASGQRENHQVGATLAGRVSEESALKAWFAAARRKENERAEQRGERRRRPVRSAGAPKMGGMLAGGPRRVSFGLILLLIIIAVTLTLSYMLNRSPSADSTVERPAASETATNLDWKG